MSEARDLDDERLAHARRVLAAAPLPLPEPFAAERMIRKMKAKARPRPWFAPTYPKMVGVWAVAAIAMFVFWPSAPVAPSLIEQAEAGFVTADRPVTLEPIIGAVTIEQGARFSLPPIDLEHRLVRLELGAIEAELAAGEALTVVTYDGTIQALGARFMVEATPGRTSISARVGALTVTPHRGLPVRLAAGRTLVLGPKRPSAPKVDAAPAVTPASSLPKIALPPAAALPPPTLAQAAAQNATLREARSVLPRDAGRAAKMAEAVLEERPTPAIEVEALALWADAERRRGDLGKAAELYGRVAIHPEGRPYAEEALLQRASIDAELGRVDDALEGLGAAERAYASGPLALERAALSAELHLRRRDPEAAASALERAPTKGRSPILARRRIEVAEALFSRDSARARSLIDPILRDNEGPPELIGAAQALLSKIEAKGAAAQ